MSATIQIYGGLGLTGTALMLRLLVGLTSSDGQGESIAQIVYWVPFLPVILIGLYLIASGVGLL